VQTRREGADNRACRSDCYVLLVRRIVPAGTQGRPIDRRPAEKEKRTVNRVLLTGRLTRDPEMRSLASGKAVTQFSVATNEYIGQGKEKAEYHNIVTWDRLAQTCGEFLGKGQQVAIEGRIQTRSWDDDTGKRHWKTEIVANHVEMLSGRRKKDYAAESAANGLAAQAAAYGGDGETDEADDGEAAAIAAAAEPHTEADEEVVAA
jgi:single-strand DNA-binding protein